jgi:hypothetical protein
MPEVRQPATGPEALPICGFSARDFGEIPFRNRRLRHLWRPARSGRLLDELAGQQKNARRDSNGYDSKPLAPQAISELIAQRHSSGGSRFGQTPVRFGTVSSPSRAIRFTRYGLQG